MLRKILNTLVFLALTAEVEGEIFDGKWGTILMPIGTAIFRPSPIKVTLFDLMLLGVLVAGVSAQGPARLRAKPVSRALSVGLLSILAECIWGLVMGGDMRQTTWQIHHFVLMFVAAYAMIAIYRTPKHLVGLGKTILYAGFCRAAVLIYYDLTVVRGMAERPATLTTHHDTVLFVTCIIMALSYALERRTMKAALVAFFSFAVFALCIQLNNRRLAWVSLVFALVVLYVTMPDHQLKKRIKRGALILAPVLSLYIAVGWGRTEGIFKPVGSLSTMFGKHEDASSETRNIENYNLIQTLKTNPILGTGWGHEYREISKAYDISEIFKQYRFIPHNSVLGIFAFTGFLGFVGVWVVLPVSVYFNARTRRFARAPAERAAAVSGIAIVVIYANQAYGDMGMTSLTGSMITAGAIAVAARLSVITGAWPGGKTPPPAAHKRG